MILDKDNITAFIGAVLGSSTLTAAITSWIQHHSKKELADAASTTVDSVLKWANEMNDRIKNLEALLDTRNNEILSLKVQITQLQATVDELKEQLKNK